MKRRKFLRNIGAFSAAPLVLNGLPLNPFATPSMLSMLNCDGIDERILVVVFLKGGNDGVNTLVPINQYDTYATHRPDIKLNNTGANAITNLDSTIPLADQVGVQPKAMALKEMYDDGIAAVIQAVGYPNINQSHFKSTDLWLTGGDGTPANFNLQSGWMGRYFDSAFAGISGGPMPGFPDPLGIQLGDPKPSIGFHDHSSEFLAANLGWQYPGDLSGLLNGLGTAPHSTMLPSDYGSEIEYIMNVENSTNAYGQRITDVFNAGSNSAVTYPNTGLGYQLSSVARMISGGSKTKVFLVHTYGYDTHANQVQAGASHTGKHADILEDLFTSIKVFIQDLTNLGFEDKVTTTTFSEFGRRVTQNGSLGTDHGLLAPMFVFGSSVTPGVYGTNLNLSNLDNNGNVVEQYQYDYRGIFKTLMQDWLGADDVVLAGAQMAPYSKINNLINSNNIVTPDCYLPPVMPLPVSLVSFEVEKSGKQALISWAAFAEIEMSHYELERSKDGVDFEFFLKKAITETGLDRHDYDAIDDSPHPGINYYRLKAIDLDGSFVYSEIRHARFENETIKHLKIYPNPARFDTNLVMTTEKGGELNVSILNASGQQLKSIDLNHKRGFNKFNISLDGLAAGFYFINITGEYLEDQTLKLKVLD